MPKLTLSADREVIELAKRVAASQNTSVSAMVARMFRAIAARGPSSLEQLPPITKAASGIVRLPADRSDQELLEAALGERYGVSG